MLPFVVAAADHGVDDFTLFIPGETLDPSSHLTWPSAIKKFDPLLCQPTGEAQHP